MPVYRRLGTASRADRSEFDSAGAAIAAVAQLAATLGSAASQDSDQFDLAGAAAGAVGTHEGKPNPHGQYELKTALKSAAYTAATDYASTAQGTKADAAVQPSSGTYAALTVPRYADTTGKLLKSSAVTITDANRVGINGAAPGSTLQVNGTGVENVLHIRRSDGLDILRCNADGSVQIYGPLTVWGGNFSSALSSNTYLQVGAFKCANNWGYDKIYFRSDAANLTQKITTDVNGNLSLITAAKSFSFPDASAVIFGGPLKLPTYTVATVPSASANVQSVIYVSNEVGGATPAFSDGTNWRRIHDRQVIA